ncbi:MAG: DUF3106 domain-containing protein [Deltaproteobacteria bacterium]|nr:DUF3106 domain-containing protein [Deltaproteobacteria bacterium]
MRTRKPTRRPRYLHRLALIVAAATILPLLRPIPAWPLTPQNTTLRLSAYKGFLMAQSPRENDRLRRQYEQWQRMSPQEKEMIRRRMDQWNRMSPQDRQRYQRRYEQWQDLSPEERGRINRKLDQWESLPPQERNGVRSRFR